MPPFCQTVDKVVSACSKKQVIWASARRIVARVKNVLAIGDRSKMKHPTCPVSNNELALVSTFFDVAVAIAVGRCRPKPASVSSDNFAPKPFGEGNGEALINHPLGSNLVHSISSLPVRGESRRAFSLSPVLKKCPT